MSDFIHIVCLDVPFPPDYGGAIDMYYKIASLHANGKKVILHYFNYRPGLMEGDLSRYCVEIYSYPRTGVFKGLSFRLPYIVKSRINKHLITRLNQDDFPVILEGIHCSGIMPYLHKNRNVIIRMHNNEPDYYRSLSLSKGNWGKRIYFYLESVSLARYQRALPKNTPLACISARDTDVFQQEYHFTNVQTIPCFIPWQQIIYTEGKGKYCLYHGNLSIAENEAAAAWLIEKVFSGLEIPLIVAGKGISQSLSKAAAKHSNVRLVGDPPLDKLNNLIRNAQINVLPSLNNTGVKLKLLHALIEGRFCITNFCGMLGTGIGVDVPLVVTDIPSALKEKIKELFLKEFHHTTSQHRQILLQGYNNRKNARSLIALL